MAIICLTAIIIIIITNNPYSVTDFCKAHFLLTEGLVKEAGRFRSGDVAVYDGTQIMHVGARPQFVPNLVNDLLIWGKTTDLHPLLKAAVLHYEIEIIHPFADGNGRMGRLWQTLTLAKRKKIFAWMPMETVLYENRQGYYDAIQTARRHNDASPFIEFVLWAIETTVTRQSKIQPKPPCR